MGITCWWETVLEIVSERLVEIDSGTKCMGGQIYIPAGNVACSPGGLCVISSKKGVKIGGTFTLQEKIL